MRGLGGNDGLKFECNDGLLSSNQMSRFAKDLQEMRLESSNRDLVMGIFANILGDDLREKTSISQNDLSQ